MISSTPHHIGCAVSHQEEGLATYAVALGPRRRTRPFDVVSQHVSVCFVELVDGFYLELVTPLSAEARLANYLRAGFYHLCYLVNDLGAARKHLEGRRFVALPAFASEAFAGGLCQFFVSPQGHLIELAEMSPHDFDQLFNANLRSA